MNLIDGKAISAKCKAETAEEIKSITATGLRAPCLAVILVGDDPASAVYVRNKKRACEAVGITSLEYLLSADETEEKLLELIDFLNKDETVDGILVQMPVPKQTEILLSFLGLHRSTAFWTLLLNMMATPFLLTDS